MHSTRSVLWLCSLLLGTGCLREDIVHAADTDATGGPANDGGSDDTLDSSASQGTEDDGESTGDPDGDSGGTEPTDFPDEGPFGSGTRLRPVVERNSEGTSRFLYWFDSELGIDCEFVHDSVGTLRCLPRAAPAVLVGYANEDCTGPVASSATCASMPSFVRGVLPGASPCIEGPRHQAFRRLEPLGDGPVRRYSAGEQDCAGASNVGGDRYALELVDDAMFLEGVAVDELVGELAIHGIVGLDGSYQRSTLVDPGSGLPCSTLNTAGPAGELGPVSCASVPSSWGQTFADSACTVALYAFPVQDVCEAIPYVLGHTGERIAPGAVHEGPAYVTSQGQCVLDDAPAMPPLAQLREGMPLGQHPAFEVESVMLADEGRLQRIGVGVGGGIALVDHSTWIDSLLLSGCTTMRTPNGDTVCASDPLKNNSPFRYWNDPECSETELHSIIAEWDTPARVTFVDNDECHSTVQEVRNVYDDYEGPLFFGEAGDCTAEAPDDFIRYVQLGNHVDISDLPTLEVVTLD